MLRVMVWAPRVPPGPHPLVDMDSSFPVITRYPLMLQLGGLHTHMHTHTHTYARTHTHTHNTLTRYLRTYAPTHSTHDIHTHKQTHVCTKTVLEEDGKKYFYGKIDIRL